MLVGDLLDEVSSEQLEKKKAFAKEILAEKLRERDRAYAIYNKIEKEIQVLINTDIDEFDTSNYQY
jgi:hypothetical protein